MPLLDDDNAVLQRQATMAAMMGHMGDIDGSMASAPTGGFFCQMITNWLAGPAGDQKDGPEENHGDGLPGSDDTGE